jgi:hypothetical protein
LEKENVRKMVKAMQQRRQLKDVAAAILSFDGTYEVGHALNVNTGPLKFRYVEAKAYPASDPSGILCQSSEYDPFNYLLLSDVEANAAAAMRAAYANPEVYGHSEDWIIWAYDAQLGGLLRFKASGYLSALKAAFPDEATRLLATSYGIDLSSAERPVLIIREADLGKLVTKDDDE